MRVISVRLVNGIDLRAVDSLPDTVGRQLVVHPCAPPQFCCVEADLTAMSGERRQSVTEAEAVGQHDVVAAVYSKLLFKEYAHYRFSRRHHYVVGIDRATRHVPASGFDISLQFGIIFGIIFLHPAIAYRALKVQMEGRIFIKQFEVIRHGFLHIFPDGSLYIPVPLRVKMGIGYEEERGLLCACGEERSSCRSQKSLRGCHLLQIFLKL